MTKEEIAISSIRGVPGAKELMIQQFDIKSIVVFDYIKNLVRVSKSFYLSTAYGIAFILNADEGKLHRLSLFTYDIRIEEKSLYLIEKKTGLIHRVIYRNRLNFDVVSVSSKYSIQGSDDYLIIIQNFYFPNGCQFRFKLKVHLLFAAIRYGYKALDAVGDNATLEVHHDDVDRYNNRPYNLILLPILEHRSIKKQKRLTAK